MPNSRKKEKYQRTRINDNSGGVFWRFALYAHHGRPCRNVRGDRSNSPAYSTTACPVAYCSFYVPSVIPFFADARSPATTLPLRNLTHIAFSAYLFSACVVRVRGYFPVFAKEGNANLP